MNDEHQTSGPPRRDVVATAALGFVGAGLLLATWPFIAQMFPNAGSEKPEALEVDLSGIEPGKAITVAWREKPVLIRRRNAREIEASRAVPLAALIDRISRNEALPPEANALDDNRLDKDNPQWLVVTAVCTHDRCIIRALENESGAEPREAFACPCDNSRFDLAGRVRNGPARLNLTVPAFRIIGPHRLRLG